MTRLVDDSLDGWPAEFPLTEDGGVEEGLVVLSRSGTIQGRTTGDRSPCRSRGCPGWFIGVRWQTGQLGWPCSEGWTYDSVTKTVRITGGGEISARVINPKPLGVDPLPRDEWPDAADLLRRKGWRPHKAEEIGLGDRGAKLLSPPPHPEFPLFVYGSLQPGELAHHQVRDLLLSSPEAAELRGARLLVRDGLPLLKLDPEGSGATAGWLLDLGEDGYDAVRAFEPHHLYRWEEAGAVTERGSSVGVNVLVGRSLTKGRPVETDTSWTSCQDPVLLFAPTVAQQMQSNLDDDVLLKSSPAEDERYWGAFFRLQAAYLLLWTAYERLTALRYGPALDPMERLGKLEGDGVFQQAFKEAGARTGQVVYDSRDLDRITIGENGENALRYWYQVRSNLSHRGKSAYKESTIVYEAFRDAHRVLEHLLQSLIGRPMQSGV